jgi:hypothetical protein
LLRAKRERLKGGERQHPGKGVAEPVVGAAHATGPSGEASTHEHAPRIFRARLSQSSDELRMMSKERPGHALRIITPRQARVSS